MRENEDVMNLNRPNNEIISKSVCRKVPVSGDGRCFFRCVSVHPVSELRNCKRLSLGVAERKGLEILEKHLADQIRKEAVSLLKLHESVLTTMSSSFHFYLDKEIGQQYVTLSDRLTCMERTSEFADFLEISAVAYLLQMRICIYQETNNRKNYHLRAALPVTHFDNMPVIHLLHYSDSKEKHDGHYDLIIPNTNAIDADNLPNKANRFNVEFDEQRNHATIMFLIPNQTMSFDFIELINSITSTSMTISDDAMTPVFHKELSKQQDCSLNNRDTRRFTVNTQLF